MAKAEREREGGWKEGADMMLDKLDLPRIE